MTSWLQWESFTFFFFFSLSLSLSRFICIFLSLFIKIMPLNLVSFFLYFSCIPLPHFLSYFFFFSSSSSLLSFYLLNSSSSFFTSLSIYLCIYLSLVLCASGVVSIATPACALPVLYITHSWRHCLPYLYLHCSLHKVQSHPLSANPRRPHFLYPSHQLEDRITTNLIKKWSRKMIILSLTWQ